MTFVNLASTRFPKKDSRLESNLGISFCSSFSSIVLLLPGLVSSFRFLMCKKLQFRPLVHPVGLLKNLHMGTFLCS